MPIYAGSNLISKIATGISSALAVYAGGEIRFGGEGGVTPPPWSPYDLFMPGDEGVWFDLDDDMDTKLQWCIDNPAYTNATFLAQFPNHTLFQDSAGTTAVTAVEQPLGLVLDKSKGLVRETELITNGDFSSATGWTVPATWSVTGGKAVGTAVLSNKLAQTILTVGRTYLLAMDVDAVSGDTYTMYAGAANCGQISGTGRKSAILTATATGTFSVSSWSGTGLNITIDNISVKEIPGNHRTQATAASRPAWSARKNLLLATATMSTQNITSVATPYTISHTGTGTITLSGTSTAGPLVGAGSLTFTPTAGTLTMTVSGTVSNAQLEYGSTATTYQRVTTATDYNAIGFPKGCKYDGVDDGMATASIDFSANAQMSTCVGLQKLSDSAEGSVISLSADPSANNGTFHLLAPPAISGNNFGYTSRGTTQALALTGATYPSPTTQVLSAFSDTFNDVAQISVGSGGASSNSADQGNLSYGNYPLYFGRRGGASFPFTGVEYNTTIINRPLTTDELDKLEQFNATKSGVVL